MKREKIITSSLFLIAGLSVGLLGYQAWSHVQAYKLAFARGGLVLYSQQEVLGASAVSAHIQVDFNKKNGNINPEIFGGAHNPDLNDTDAWEKIAETGFTSLRKDLYLDKVFPSGTSLDGYKRNDANIQNPQNWNKSEIQPIQEIFSRAHSYGMKTTAIMAYSPAWLSSSGTAYGVPKDWQVYEDIVAKLYELHRNNIDRIEIWNEPDYDFFLKTDGTSFTRPSAYEQIFIHAARAIRSVDIRINDGKIIPIGGPVVSNPTQTVFLEQILNNPESAKYLDFVSYHNYEHIPEPSDGAWRSILAKFHKESLPIYLSEWAYTPQIKQPSPYVLNAAAIPYTANKLLTYMHMGLAGSDYFALQKVDPTSAYGNIGYLGMYRWDAGRQKAELLPAAATWRLMSVSLGLGKGTSNMLETSSDTPLTMMAAQNSVGDNVLVVSNPGQSTVIAQLTMQGLPVSTYSVHAFTASGNSDGSQDVISSLNLQEPLAVYIPAESVVGIRLENTMWAKMKLRELIRKLSTMELSIRS